MSHRDHRYDLDGGISDLVDQIFQILRGHIDRDVEVGVMSMFQVGFLDWGLSLTSKRCLLER